MQSLSWKLASRLAVLSLSAALIGCAGGDEAAPEAGDMTEGGPAATDPAGGMESGPVMEAELPEIAPAPAPAEEAPAEEAQDIVDIAVGNEDFETLVAALQAAELVETLKGDGPFTVFAPTDAAFEALPEGTLDDLLKPENKDQLVAVLTYHVVPGKVMAADVLGMNGQSATSVEGSDIPIQVEGETVKVAGATVTATDIEASNGVIHVIDAVILPPSE